MATYDRLVKKRAVDGISDAFIFHSSYSRTNHKMHSTVPCTKQYCTKLHIQVVNGTSMNSVIIFQFVIQDLPL